MGLILTNLFEATKSNSKTGLVGSTWREEVSWLIRFPHLRYVACKGLNYFDRKTLNRRKSYHLPASSSHSSLFMNITQNFRDVLRSHFFGRRLKIDINHYILEEIRLTQS